MSEASKSTAKVKRFGRFREECQPSCPAALAPVDRPGEEPLRRGHAESSLRGQLRTAGTAKTSSQDQEHREDIRTWPGQ